MTLGAFSQPIPSTHYDSLRLKSASTLAGDQPFIAREVPRDLPKPIPVNFTTVAFTLQPDAQAIKSLLAQARYWVNHSRDDLARETIAKLFLIAPENIDGLELLARIAMRERNYNLAADLLKRMRKQQPDALAVQQIAALLQAEDSGTSQLKQARQFARAGRYVEAVEAMRRQFPVLPGEEITLEYWNMVANTPNGWQKARAALQDLVNSDPTNPRYRFELDKLLTTHPPYDRAALTRIIAMTEDPAFAKRARVAWREAILDLSPSANTIALLENYLAHEKNDSAVQAKLDGMRGAVQQRRRQLADPVFRAQHDGLALLAADKTTQAEPLLVRAYESHRDDVEVINGLGLLRLRQKRHAESEALFLRAAKIDPVQRARWQKMAGVAHYWGLITQADVAAKSGQTSVALQLLEQAHQQMPNEPRALIDSAALLTAERRFDAAEAQLKQVLRIAPAEPEAIKGLLQIYLLSSHPEKADNLLAQLTPAERRKFQPIFDQAQAGRLREQAEQQEKDGQHDDAIRTLEAATALDRTDPWLRFDLAKLYGKRRANGDERKADQLFSTLLATNPTDSAAWYAYALIDSARDKPDQGLRSLEHIVPADRTDKITQLQRRLWVATHIRFALATAANGQTARASELLQSTAKAIGDDAELLLPVADAAAEIGAIDTATAVLDQMQRSGSTPQAAASQLRRAEVIARFKDDQALEKALVQIQPVSERDRLDLETLQQTLLERRVEKLIELEQFDAAMSLLSATNSTTVRSQLLRASTALKLHNLAEAETRYRAILQNEPTNQDAAIGLIDTLIAEGNNDEATIRLNDQLRLLNARPAPMDSNDAATLISRLMEVQQNEAALQLLNTALTSAPNNRRLLQQAAQLAERDHDPDAAIAYLQRLLGGSADTTTHRSHLVVAADNPAVDAKSEDRTKLAIIPAVAPIVSSDTYLERKLADLLDQRSTWIAGGVDVRTRDGSVGKSNYRYVEVPLEWKQPGPNGTRLSVQSALVNVDAGSIDLSQTSDASRFGTVLLCQPNCNSGIFRQKATGLALSTSLERDNWRVDVGTTPIGFPVQQVTGGFLTKGDLGKLSYSLDLSRRAVTGSVLSYAGARDPRTGETWGGVVASGVRIGLSRDSGGAFGAWSSLGLHQLSGKNVPANNRVQLMGGGYWRAINEEDRLLSLGLTGMVWHHAKNDGEYTFGHGGYYSPERFQSLSIPITFAQRSQRLSYSVRAALSTSRSSTARADYYPGRPDLQAQATAAGSSPFYSASTGGGIGRSLAAQFEYQLDADLFVGGRFEIDRSSDYAPNRAFVYFRYNLDHDSARPVTFPPEPFIPPSQY